MDKYAVRTEKAILIISFILMITVNAMANALPINNQNTGQVSDSYPNLFAPTGLTFAIWGLIYLLLAGHTMYQAGFFQKEKNNVKTGLLQKVGIYFTVSSLTNAAWIFSWHYHMIPLSMALMILLLACLILINQTIKKEELSLREKLFIKLPFSVYFGWITVATIANATVLLVSLGWDGFGIPEETWAIIIISVGLLIGSVTTIRNKDFAYGFVIIWAYAGIIIKHTSANGFESQYPTIIGVTAAAIVILLIIEVYIYRLELILNRK